MENTISAFAYDLGKIIENKINKYNKNLADNNKLLEGKILSWCAKKRDPEFAAFFGVKERTKGVEWVDEPRLDDPEDKYYSGRGCTWGTDLDGNKYHKLYSFFNDQSKIYPHLNHGDIVNEKARIEKYIENYLNLDHSLNYRYYKFD